MRRIDAPNPRTTQREIDMTKEHDAARRMQRPKRADRRRTDGRHLFGVKRIDTDTRRTSLGRCSVGKHRDKGEPSIETI